MSKFLSNLLQLSFTNSLNSLYTVLLLLLVVALIVRRLQLAKSQGEWDSRWQEFSKTCQSHLEQVPQAGDTAAVQGYLSKTWMEDLVPLSQTRGSLPPVEGQVQTMLEKRAHKSQLDLYSFERSIARWDKVAGFAILLGLLGTFIGLTLALLQLPVKGGLKLLTGGLQQVLPLMGTAFWTSVCGLISSLLIRISNRKAEALHFQRTQLFTNFVEESAHRVLHGLYPRIAPAVGGGVAVSGQTSADWGGLLESIEAQQSKQQQALEGLLQSLQRGTQALQQTLETLPVAHQSLQGELEALQQSVSTLNPALATLGQQLQTGLQPWQEATGTLSTQFAQMHEQTQSIQALLERAAASEEQWPAKVNEVLQQSLQPAQQLLQKSARTLLGLVHQQSEKSIQEQQKWRALLQEFQQGLALSSPQAGMTQELSRMTDTLSELSARLQFQAALNLEDDEDDLFAGAGFSFALDDKGEKA